MTESSHDPERQSGLLIFLMLCCAGIIAMGVAGWFYVSHKQRDAEPPAAAIALMTPAEREYLSKIQVHLVTVQQAENYAHEQQVILNGKVVNAGARGVGELQLSVQFLNKRNEIVSREMAEVWAATEPGMAAGETRSFTLTLENVPLSWNGLPPTICVSHLLLLP